MSDGTASRIQFLEATRGIAASIVVVQHVLAHEWAGYREWSLDYLDLGRVGVVAFFMVSGYVIPLSFAHQTQRTFWVRRFFRLYPVFWLAFGLYAVLHFEDTLSQSAGVVALNLLMIQGLLGALDMLPPSWTLSIELLFYAQVSAAKRIGLDRLVVHAGWVWLGCYLAMNLLERVRGTDLPTTLPMLLACAALGQALHERDRDGRGVWAPLGAAMLVVVPAGAYLGVDGGITWSPFTYSTSFVAGIALFAAFYLRREARFPAWTIWLGAVSYAMYLFHPVVNDALALVLPGGWPMVLANAIAVPLVSWLVHVQVERRSIEVGRRLTRPRTRALVDEQAAP